MAQDNQDNDTVIFERHAEQLASSLGMIGRVYGSQVNHTDDSKAAVFLAASLLGYVGETIVRDQIEVYKKNKEEGLLEEVV